MQHELLRALPSVEELVSETESRGVAVPRPVIVRVAQAEIGRVREKIRNGERQGAPEEVRETLSAQVAARVAAMRSPLPTINATGVILHTGLGRAPLSEAAARAAVEAASGYCTLEISTDSGERQSRLLYLDELLQTWSGAPASLVVNNNAAAMFLALHSLAAGQKVIIPRAEMVEIGGSFRLPEILAASGVRMAEIGTTNKVRIRDYEEAIDEGTALIIKVHSSNYRVVGFTEYAGLDELVDLGRRRNVPVLFDLGSGAGSEWRGLIAPDEPIVQDAVKAGVDLLSFSGDKLLGGPQAGVLLGREDLIAQLRQDPLARALRIDKMALAALAATLELYLAGQDSFRAQLPLARMITDEPKTVKKRASLLLKKIEKAVSESAAVTLCETVATVGGGSVPGEEIPSWAVAVKPTNCSVGKLAAALRSHEPPVFGYVSDDAFLLDVRTVFDEQLPAIAEAVVGALEGS